MNLRFKSWKRFVDQSSKYNSLFKVRPPPPPPKPLFVKTDLSPPGDVIPVIFEVLRHRGPLRPNTGLAE